jgi:hypothetical protein
LNPIFINKGEFILNRIRAIRRGIISITVISLLCSPHSLPSSSSYFSSAQQGVWAQTASAENVSIPLPTVYVPYFDGEIKNSQTAIFWFGRITERENGADVRIGYNDTELYVRVSVFDQHAWYNPKPQADQLDLWDAVSLYISPDPLLEDGLSQPIRFVSQLRNWESGDAFQAAWTREADQWLEKPISFSSSSGWRGGGMNDNSRGGRGWRISFQIPFASLNLVEPPVAGSQWKIAVVVHDRDGADVTSIQEQIWPPAFKMDDPESWGNLVYGLPPAYTAPAADNLQTITIRHGLDGAVVPDAEVGGSTICGSGMNFWRDWGEANYAGGIHVNVQNQIDIADWPCFSRYYVTFPLDALPQDKVVVSTTLTLHQFGNSGEGYDPGPLGSTIQVFTVEEAWEESSITWNNAPLAGKNVSRARVEPLASFPGHPGVPRTWDLSQTVAEVYPGGNPLRLALYSADSAYHSGKYFVSSDAEDWNAVARPTLQVVLGDPLETAAPSPVPSKPPVGDSEFHLYLPSISQ